MGTQIRHLPYILDGNHFNAQLAQLMKKLDCCKNLISKELTCPSCKSSPTMNSKSKYISLLSTKLVFSACLNYFS